MICSRCASFKIHQRYYPWEVGPCAVSAAGDDSNSVGNERVNKATVSRIKNGSVSCQATRLQIRKQFVANVFGVKEWLGICMCCSKVQKIHRTEMAVVTMLL